MTPSPFDAMPVTRPEAIAADVFLIPNLAPGPDGLLLPVNSMVIRGREPVIVDTGAPVHREQWLEKVFAVVEPEDVRWIFLSHDDGDHTGALFDVLERCPRATLVTNFFAVERLQLEKPALPLARMRWVEPGGSFDAGDRVLRLFRPPVFDGPTSRGLFDPKSGAMWIVDSFACFTPGSLDRRGRPGRSSGTGRCQHCAILHGGRPYPVQVVAHTSTSALRCRYGWGRPSHCFPAATPWRWSTRFGARPADPQRRLYPTAPGRRVRIFTSSARRDAHGAEAFLRCGSLRLENPPCLGATARTHGHPQATPTANACRGRSPPAWRAPAASPPCPLRPPRPRPPTSRISPRGKRRPIAGRARSSS